MRCARVAIRSVAKAISTSRAFQPYLEAFREIVSRIEKSLAESGAKLTEPVKMYVAGGAAVHFYTGARISADIDATFSRRLLLPSDLEVEYRDGDGSTRLLYLDRQYNDTLGLMHENAHLDSLPLRLAGIDSSVVEVRLLSPVDVAVSKVARFEPEDQNDIRRLAEARLIEVDGFRERALDALQGYVGRREAVELSIRLACKIIAESSPPPPPPGSRGKRLR